AGEQAIARKLLDWPGGTAQQACRQLFGEWIATMGDGNVEDRQILRSIGDFIALHGDSRFSDAHSDYNNALIRDRAGYYEIEEGRRLYLFNRPALTEAAPGFGCDR
ncbi:RNA helicase, partial [Pseudomonas aeruginosa]|nr:RNA helicase [Pseudomonas aeruginosa]